ncbi:VOC family protein [Myxococcus fulvus]|uniref:VOC family protein n=1 Tax=Myxococcus fulvus TaxID=33 RepID=UPI003B9CAD18
MLQLDHFGFVTTDLDASVRFYEACLKPLGLGILERGEGFVIFGTDAKAPFLWVGTLRPSTWKAEHAPARSPLHIAFAAKDRAVVDAFHQRGLAAGGRDNGAPGVREGGFSYYAAFLLDPDGNNIEACVRLT